VLLQDVGVDQILWPACCALVRDQESDLMSIAALDELDEVRTEEPHRRTPD
jgi:hypothetical protein